MREYALRTGSSYDERGERQQGKTRQPGGTRSKRSVNLGRLADEVGLDLLGAALGVTDQTVKILVDGRDHAREDQFTAHLMHKLEDAGIPLAWLERPFAPIKPEYTHALKFMASESKNRVPIRRYNFKRLAKAFDGRLDVLGDALEMINSSVSNVADGRLDLDDHRFGHINPRLMRAGFPDGWLEMADPELTDAMLEGLEQLATDEYEQSLGDSDEIESTVGQAFVSPPPPQAAAKEAAASVPIESSKETTMAKPTPQQAPAAEQPTQPSLPTFAAPQFKAAGMPGATPTMAHPGAKLPRSVLAAGRKVAAPAAAPKANRGAAKAAAPAAAPDVETAPMPQAAEVAQQTLSLKPKKPAPAPVATPAHAPVQEAAPAAAPAMNRLGAVSTEVSLARAEALEKLFEACPRGVKGLLWKNILGFQLPAWGNIRRGHAKFRNTLADAVEEAMGLPNGWLDAPSYPPASLAAWVTTPGAALPPCPPVLEVEKTGRKATTEAAPTEVAAPAPVAAAPVPAPVAATPAEVKPAATPKTRPFARKTALVPPKVTMTTPPASKPAPKGKAAPAAVATAPAAPAPAVEPPAVAAQAVAPAPVVAAPAPAAAPAPTAQVAAAGTTWAAPQGQPGPICQALMSIMAAKSAAGGFSEQEALAMLNKLMAQ